MDSLFNMTYIPFFLNLEGVIEKYEHRNRENQIGRPRVITSIVNDKDEPIKDVIKTISLIAQTNNLAREKDIGIQPIVSKVVLSDQSGPELAKKKKDVLIKEVSRLKHKLGDEAGLLPEFGYFSIGSKMAKTIANKWGNVDGLENFVRMVKETGEVLGKGVNMWLASMYANSDVFFHDADDKKRSTRQSLAELLGMQLGYKAVIGTFTRYHQNDKGDMERGGRVNAATGGLFDMLTNKRRLLCLLGYPLSGDQGFDIDTARKIYHHKRFGEETALRIQLHSEVNRFTSYQHPLVADEYLLQVELEKNDDRPIGIGKPKKKILEDIGKMTRDVAEAYLSTIGFDNLRNHWATKKDFMVDFKERQFSRMHKWAEASEKDHGKELLISGGVTDKELKELSYNVIQESVNNFYDNPLITTKDGRNIPYIRSLSEDFLPSINSLIESNGEERYNDLVKDLREHYTAIA